MYECVTIYIHVLLFYLHKKMLLRKRKNSNLQSYFCVGGQKYEYASSNRKMHHPVCHQDRLTL